MANFISRSQLFQRGVEVLVQRGQLRPPETRLTREAAETPGTDTNIFLAAASFMADSVTQAAAQRFADLFFDSARAGEPLERLIKDRVSPEVVVKESQSALVNLQFSRTTDTTAVSFNVGDRYKTNDGTTFELTQAGGLGIGQTTSALIPAQAITPGIAGNVAAGSVTQFVTDPPEAGISVTNPEVGSGGRDRESAASLRARAKSFWKSVRRGTKSAIAFGANRVQGVFSVNVIEEFDESGVQTGIVFVYVADSNGQSNSLINAAVYQELEEYRAAGVYPSVRGGVPSYQDIVFDVTTESGYDPDRVTAQIAQAVVARVNALKPGQDLLRSLLIKTASSVAGAIVSDTSLVTPATDKQAAASEIFKTSIARVTFQ